MRMFLLATRPLLLAFMVLPHAARADAEEALPALSQPLMPEEKRLLEELPGQVALEEVLREKEDRVATGTHTPFISEFTRHIAGMREKIWWNDATGAPLGLVQRDFWKQFFRDHFVYFDEQGERRAEGAHPIFSLGFFARSLRELYVTDAEGELVASMSGKFWTTDNYRFLVKDKEGIRIADAHVDRYQSSIVFTLPNKPAARVATLLRERVTDDGLDKWRMIVMREGIVPDDAWPIISAFFARFQDNRLIKSGLRTP